jgi:hypothetical protein
MCHQGIRLVPAPDCLVQEFCTARRGISRKVFFAYVMDGHRFRWDAVERLIEP